MTRLFLIFGYIALSIPAYCQTEVSLLDTDANGRVSQCVCSGQSACEREPAILDLDIPDKTLDTWHGFRRHRFRFEGQDAWIVEPNQAKEGGLFSWCLMFPDAFTERCAAPQLLEEGFFHVYLDVGNSFGSPSALARLRAFHEMLIQRGFAKRAVLIGISRGGLYSHRYASENPESVSVIYGDAPVLDFKSWPGGFGKGKGSPGDWKLLKELYGFPSDTQATTFPGNPIDTLKPLADEKICLIYVAGEADDVVPWEENGKIASDRYKQLGGKVEVILKNGIGHHPHGLENPRTVVDFILKNARKE